MNVEEHLYVSDVRADCAKLRKRAEKAEAKLKWAYDEGYDHGTRLGRKWDEDELKAEAQA